MVFRTNCRVLLLSEYESSKTIAVNYALKTLGTVNAARRDLAKRQRHSGDKPVRGVYLVTLDKAMFARCQNANQF